MGGPQAPPIPEKPATLWPEIAAVPGKFCVSLRACGPVTQWPGSGFPAPRLTGRIWDAGDRQ